MCAFAGRRERLKLVEVSTQATISFSLRQTASPTLNVGQGRPRTSPAQAGLLRLSALPTQIPFSVLPPSTIKQRCHGDDMDPTKQHRQTGGPEERFLRNLPSHTWLSCPRETTEQAVGLGRTGVLWNEHSPKARPYTALVPLSPIRNLVPIPA